MEIFRVTPEVSEVIAKGARAHAIEAAARRQGDQPLLTEAIRHAVNGRIALSEALAAQAAWAEGWNHD
jgi:type II secretory ATPase GspE/PulE/Tfp pilus assembly ATPase PilB-like protein